MAWVPLRGNWHTHTHTQKSKEALGETHHTHTHTSTLSLRPHCSEGMQLLSSLACDFVVAHWANVCSSPAAEKHPISTWPSLLPLPSTLGVWTPTLREFSPWQPTQVSLTCCILSPLVLSFPRSTSKPSHYIYVYIYIHLYHIHPRFGWLTYCHCWQLRRIAAGIIAEN